MIPSLSPSPLHAVKTRGPTATTPSAACWSSNWPEADLLTAAAQLACTSIAPRNSSSSSSSGSSRLLRHHRHRRRHTPMTPRFPAIIRGSCKNRLTWRSICCRNARPFSTRFALTEIWRSPRNWPKMDSKSTRLPTAFTKNWTCFISLLDLLLLWVGVMLLSIFCMTTRYCVCAVRISKMFLY